MIVFDDSSPANQEKYYPLLEQTHTHNELFYVGPREKEQFLAYLNQRLRDKRLEGLVKNLFRPELRRQSQLHADVHARRAHGQLRRRHAAVRVDGGQPGIPRRRRGLPRTAAQGRAERLHPQVVRHPRGLPGRARQDRSREVPENYERGELLVDTAMDLETNATKGLARENSLMLRAGPLADDAVVKMAQTFRSGTNDIDAMDFVEMFLADDDADRTRSLNDLYVLVNFRPAVTKKNWRMDCGVAGYDNTFGLPPFFPDPAAVRGLHLPAVGAAGRRRRGPRGCRPAPHARATTCAIRPRRRSSTRKSRTCSSARSRPASPASTS